MKRLAFALTICAMSALGLDAASAAGVGGLGKGLRNAPAIQYIVARQPTLAPFAHVIFCMKQPADCASRGGPAMIALSDPEWRMLASVNRTVNRTIRPRYDRPGAIGGDEWSLAPRQGDCEDYAITKRHRLIALGWPAAALRLAVARTPWGEGHAVLVVKTDRGDLVLDNRSNTIRPYQATDLRWEKIQSSENPHMWYAL